MKKRTKRFLGTLAIIGVFAVGTVFGANTLLKFTGINTINEAETLIQKLTQERNTIVDEYNKLNETATNKIKSLESDINSLKVEIETLTQERDKLLSEQSNNTQRIDSLNKKIKSLEAEIIRKDTELKGKDRLLEEKDKKIKYYENIEPTKEIARLNEELNIANSKCKELQDVIDNVPDSGFKQSDLVQDN